jgi:hypothetical protein
VSLIALSNISRSDEWTTNEKHSKNSALNCSVVFWLGLYIAGSNWMMKNSPAKNRIESGYYLSRLVVLEDTLMEPLQNPWNLQ